MEFFFPDSQDQVSPYFDFESEEHPQHRVRQRDDLYAHEVLAEVPYDGLLVSKAFVDGSSTGSSKYTLAQHQRVYRLGAHKFFRADVASGRLPIMGDCGAFTYANEEDPPYTLNEVVDFYEELGLERGVSLDHIVFAFRSSGSTEIAAPPEPDWVRRRDLTIQLASEFFAEVKKRRQPFEPIGVAHGWDVASYQRSVEELQQMGYKRVAMGGMVPLKTNDILEVLKATSDIRRRSTKLHLLGVTRTEHVPTFAKFGVSSFDSTSPFRQAFMDDTDNYYANGERYMALRVPQVEGNAALKRRIMSGQIDQRTAIDHERTCLDLLRKFDQGGAKLADVVDALHAYELIYDKKGRDRSEHYRRTLTDAPWQSCRCGICNTVGVEVIIFRGAERNKRRGFHNLTAFRRELNATQTA